MAEPFGPDAELQARRASYDAAMKQIRDDKARGVVSSTRWKRRLD